jgi:ATP-binding protein involved in chromosome partitioning
MVGPLTETDSLVEVEIRLTITGCPAAQAIERDVRQTLAKQFDSVSIVMSTMSSDEREALKKKLRGDKPIKFNPFAESDSLTRVLLVGSGKGGVGKSTLTANLAVALAQTGHKVGLLDADIFGYSIPGLLGIEQSPTKVDELMLPPIAYDVKVISIGFFVEGNKPVAWRGPMLHRAVEQFLTDVYWGDLDFLLVDLPPGTGDVAISLGQLLPQAESIVVTTPQQAASSIAERSGAIGLMTGQRVLGVIENLSYLETQQGRNYLFGEGGGLAVASRLAELSGENVPLLGQIPISAALRERTDSGQPVVVTDPQDAAASVISEIAQSIARMPRGLSGKKLGLKPI